MKKKVRVPVTMPLIGLGSEIVYAQKPYWCSATYIQMKLSLLKPRQHYDYDPKMKCPVIVFLCGGAMEQMDRNVWMGELSYFAKHGYAVACVEYSTYPRVKWPEQICDVKGAIRFLRANADRLGLDGSKIAVMGESAGGYLALAAGLSGEMPEFDSGDHMEESSAVQAVIAWYPAVSCMRAAVQVHVDTSEMPDLLDWVTPKAPPVMLLHGTADQLVPSSESEAMYEALERCGVPAELYLLEGAHHNDAPFVQDCMKERMLEFLSQHLKSMV